MNRSESFASVPHVSGINPIVLLPSRMAGVGWGGWGYGPRSPFSNCMLFVLSFEAQETFFNSAKNVYNASRWQ